MAESSHNQFPCESYISTKQMQKIKARSLPNELMSFVARNKNLVEQNVLSNNGNLSPMPDNKEIIVTVDEKPVFYKPKIKVVALEEHSTIQDGTQPINVNTRFNSLILQKNIKTSGNLDTNETALTNEVNCHQNVNNTTDNQDQNDRIEVVVSDSPSHSVRKKIYKDQEGSSDSESDEEEEKYGYEIPDEILPNDNLTEEVIQCIDLMLKENSERLKIPMTNTMRAYHPPPDCSSCVSKCKPMKNWFSDIIKKLNSADSELDFNVLNDTFFILYSHAKSCDTGLRCQMPLCGTLFKDITKVLRHEKRKIVISLDEVFEVYENGDSSNNKRFVYGCNFNILFSEYIAGGEYGRVFSSWVKIDNRVSKVAIKVLGKSGVTKKIRQEFHRMVENLPKLNSLHICTPHLLLQSEKCLLQIMPLGGKSVGKYLKDLRKEHKGHCEKKFHFGCNAGMSISQVLHYYPQILRALSFLHEKGLMHGDVKPDNMILQEKGVLQLIDLDSIRQDEPGSRCGTAGYAAPEVYHYKAEAKSDTHSVATILPAMLGLHKMKMSWNKVDLTIIENTNDRNILVADVTHRPNIKTFIEVFNKNNRILRKTIEPNKGNIAIQIKTKDYGSEAANVFRNWMMRRLPHYS